MVAPLVDAVVGVNHWKRGEIGTQRSASTCGVPLLLADR